MQIKAKKARHIRKVCCFASALGVFDFNVRIKYVTGRSYCEPQDDGSFIIGLRKGQDRYWESISLAHEMVHLKQFKRDELRYDGDNVIWWKGEKFFPIVEGYDGDDYWLAPWEMEARALQEWLVRKWNRRDRELH